MREKSEEWKNVTVRVPESKKDELDDYCKKTGINASSLIRNFIYTTLEKQKQA